MQAAGTTHPSLPFTPLQSQLPFRSDSIFYPLQIFSCTGFKCQIVLKTAEQHCQSKQFIVSLQISSGFSYTQSMDQNIISNHGGGAEKLGRKSLLKCKKSSRMNPTTQLLLLTNVVLKQTLAFIVAWFWTARYLALLILILPPTTTVKTHC